MIFIFGSTVYEGTTKLGELEADKSSLVSVLHELL